MFPMKINIIQLEIIWRAWVWGISNNENILPHFLGAEKNKYTTGVMKMHMLAAISRIYEPGIKYDIMLCLVGSQGPGKSTFFKYLAIKEEWFSDNMDHLDDENIYRKLQNHWIIEMGEMKATITAKNIEQIKSFLSRQKKKVIKFLMKFIRKTDQDSVYFVVHQMI